MFHVHTASCSPGRANLWLSVPGLEDGSQKCYLLYMLSQVMGHAGRNEALFCSASSQEIRRSQSVIKQPCMHGHTSIDIIYLQSLCTLLNNLALPMHLRCYLSNNYKFPEMLRRLVLWVA